MSNIKLCPVCGNEHAKVINFVEDVKLGRAILHVEGLKKIDCDECGIESVPDWMHDANTALIETAMSSTRAAVSRGTLRHLRQSWGINQKEASVVFGAGISAFGKWESGQAALSTPSALLVQCANKFPIVMCYLADLAGIDLPNRENVLTLEVEEKERASQSARAVEVKLFLAHSDSGLERTRPKSTALRATPAYESMWLEAA